MNILSKASYIFSAIPNKTPTPFFTEIEFKKSKIHMESKKILTCQIILSKRGNIGGIPIPDSKIYRARATKANMVLAQKVIFRSIIGRRKKKTQTYVHIIIDTWQRGRKHAPELKTKKQKTSIFTNDSGYTEYPHAEECN